MGRNIPISTSFLMEFVTVGRGYPVAVTISVIDDCGRVQKTRKIASADSRARPIFSTRFMSADIIFLLASAIDFLTSDFVDVFMC